jgi:ribosomal protein S18 acetylase RimI-like enzyme
MNADAVQVREARITDASEVVRLLSQLGHAQPAGDDSARLAAFLEQGECVLVAERDSSQPEPLLGVVTLHIAPVMHRAGPIGRLSAVVVDESARGAGVGRALVAAAEAHFAARGCAMIEVTSNKARTDAHAFYERLGYTATSVRLAKKTPALAAPP